MANVTQKAEKNGEIHPPEGLITVKQILKLLPISRRTLDARRKSGEIPYIQLGDRILFSWPDVIESLRRRQRARQLE